MHIQHSSHTNVDPVSKAIQGFDLNETISNKYIDKKRFYFH